MDGDIPNPQASPPAAGRLPTAPNGTETHLLQQEHDSPNELSVILETKL
jgi:hypothetical protein